MPQVSLHPSTTGFPKPPFVSSRTEIKELFVLYPDEVGLRDKITHDEECGMFDSIDNVHWRIMEEWHKNPEEAAKFAEILYKDSKELFNIPLPPSNEQLPIGRPVKNFSLAIRQVALVILRKSKGASNDDGVNNWNDPTPQKPYHSDEGCPTFPLPEGFKWGNGSK